MKLTVKLAAAILLAILLVQAAQGAIRIRRESALFEGDIRRDHMVLGNALAAAARRAWEALGKSDALALIETADDRETHLRIRWIARGSDAPIPWAEIPRPGDPDASSWHGRRRQLPGQEAETLFTWIPMAAAGSYWGVIEIAESLEQERRYVWKTIGSVALAGSAQVVLTGVVALIIGFLLVGRPIRRLAAMAQRVGGGDLSLGIDLRQRDEIGELADAMNLMRERLISEREAVAAETAARETADQQLRHADRLITVGKLASLVVHELGTPVNVILGRAQLIAEEYPADTAAYTHAAVIEDQSRRIAAQIRELLAFARRRGAARGRHDLADVAERTLGMISTMAQSRRVEVMLDRPESGGVDAFVDPDQVQQALTNISVNGIQAMANGGELHVQVGRKSATPPSGREAAPALYAFVSIRDQGPGMIPEVRSRLFEPFFTTKRAGEGTGLGLSVTQGIVRDSGGWIEVESTPAKGSCFTLFFPTQEVEPG